MSRQLFALGQVVATPGALDLVPDVRPYYPMNIDAVATCKGGE